MKMKRVKGRRLLPLTTRAIMNSVVTVKHYVI